MVASQHVCFEVARVEVWVSFSTFQPTKKKLTSCANVCRHWNAIITHGTLLSFDIAKENEVSSRSLTFHFVSNLTGICLLLKRDRYVFEMTQKLIQLQSKTLEKVFPKVDFLSLRTNIFDQNYVKQLFILFPSLTKLSLYAWTDSYAKLIEVCAQYERLTHLKIRVWTCSGIKYEPYGLSRLLINDSVINEICTKLQKLTSLDLHGHLDLSNRSLETMNQNHNFISIKITDGGIPIHEVDFYGVQNKPSVQFSEDVLVDFSKKHPLLEQLELYVGQVIICKAFTDKFVVNCPRIKVLKLYSSNDIDQKNE
ncbi:unnamed protein product [Rotaria magnacalcarata]|uniref:F-box domain-containing protein n=2 Tax=Rotaria magnacalcarata TaxID=392030 RepID=A0A8S2P7N8_9BILA|nr:unnamed protein product [Rotaria magnacalcarata]